MRPSLLLALVGCLPGGMAERSAFDPDLPPPSITELSVECDLEDGRWRLELSTDAWAGGGSLLWSLDGQELELHDGFRSIRAGPEGDRDLLRLDVSIIRDLRQASNGSTVFTCADAPVLLVWATDLSREPSDCVRVGADGDVMEALLAAEGTPPCERSLKL